MKMVDHDCVILCGGLGTRLRDVVGETPKVMAEVSGRPFLDLLIGHLKEQGAARIVLCTGYQAEQVESYYRNKDFGLVIDFSREENPLGTGGALKNARDIIFSDPFFVFNGDSFLPVNLADFLTFHRMKDALASLLVSQAEKADDFGRLEMDASGRIVSFKEKIQSGEESLVNAGIYCFQQAVFDRMPHAKKFSLENDLFPGLTGKEFYGYRVDQAFFDIGTPERYETAKQNLKEMNGGN